MLKDFVSIKDHSHINPNFSNSDKRVDGHIQIVDINNIFTEEFWKTYFFNSNY